ncbi:uncharacterized protein F5891DRAFT_1059063 [Suillus fuscotomentosus]|uniref:Uncharacterized protein n=1 Tax=Suillus fuscotomentosus TaxID=1912939 RepID=A0AAD4HH70_9AGAM|nr:uncharacterized protein F5891DRAFT_1059063 [Suillus fuscotomentosus]KAG1895364.1 hypothetical protein F5891DRAFT_1059063 [Suillus fuscotomentosus]
MSRGCTPRNLPSCTNKCRQSGGVRGYVDLRQTVSLLLVFNLSFLHYGLTPTLRVVAPRYLHVIAGVKVMVAQRSHPYTKWTPSGIAFSIGFLNPPSFSLAL